MYKGQVSSDFRIFPVAVALDDGEYQLNNEPLYASATYSEIWPLAHSPRIVKEGGEDVSVPEGYGIAPFLKFPRFLELLFDLCGYTIGSNCFTSSNFLSNLVLVHNCSDVICNGKIDYSDLVPNKTISEILEWLRMKFHAQIVVTPASKVVDIVLLEDILSAGYDKDLRSMRANSPPSLHLAWCTVWPPVTTMRCISPLPILLAGHPGQASPLSRG